MTQGRPSKYSAQLAAEICARMADGQSLREICRDDAMPAKSTVMLWLKSKEGFSDQYAQACQARADYWADEILEIADDGTNDWMLRKSGDDEVTVANNEHISRSKLRVDARKWLMSKMVPKKYGDRVISEVGGIGGGPLQVEDLTDLSDVERRQRLARALLGTAGGEETGS